MKKNLFSIKIKDVTSHYKSTSHVLSVPVLERVVVDGRGLSVPEFQDTAFMAKLAHTSTTCFCPNSFNFSKYKIFLLSSVLLFLFTPLILH